MCSKGAHRTQALALSLGEPMTAGGAYTSRLERLSLAVFAWTSATRDQQGSDFFLISSTNIRKATTISSLPPFHCFFRSVSICCYVLAVFWYLDFQNLLATQLPKCLDLLLSSFIASPLWSWQSRTLSGERDVVICNISSNKWLCLKLGYPWLPQLLMCYLHFYTFTIKHTLKPINIATFYGVSHGLPMFKELHAEHWKASVEAGCRFGRSAVLDASGGGGTDEITPAAGTAIDSP